MRTFGLIVGGVLAFGAFAALAAGVCVGLALVIGIGVS